MLNKIKKEIQDKVLDLIKENGRFKFEDKDVPREQVLHIKCLSVGIHDDGRILFSGTCELKKVLDGGFYDQFACKFEAWATLNEDDHTVELDDQPILIKPQH